MNLMKHIPNAVTLKFGRAVLLGQKHSPTILFGVGIVGVVATAVLAARATLKLDETLDLTEKNLDTAKSLHDTGHAKYSDKAYQKDVAIQYVRCVGSITRLYAPAIIVGVATVSSLAGSRHILTTRNAGLTAAYAAVSKGFAEYRDRVSAEVGPDKELEYRYGTETHEIVEDTKKGPKVSQVKRVGPNGASIYARFFDESSEQWSPNPMYNLALLRSEQNYANDMLHSRGHIFLNEVYDKLDLPRSEAGQAVGWIMSKDTDNFVDFGIYNGDSPAARDFVNGHNGAILLDFNVDVIMDKIERL